VGGHLRQAVLTAWQGAVGGGEVVGEQVGAEVAAGPPQYGVGVVGPPSHANV
jgi:hypothetical protein